MEALESRQRAAAEWNMSLQSQIPKWTQLLNWNVKAALHKSLPSDYEKYGSDSSFAERRKTLENEWRKRSGKKRGSVTWALNDVMTGFWAGGATLILAHR